MEDASATHSQRRCLICRRSKRHNGATVKNKIMSPNWENITSVFPLETHAFNDASLIFSWISQVLTMCPGYFRDKSHMDRFGLARVKQIWIRFDGKTRLTGVEEEEEEEAVRLEERMREMMDVKEKTGIYIVCEESRLYGGDVVRLEEVKMVDVALRVEGV